jgi:hypothetical protein
MPSELERGNRSGDEGGRGLSRRTFIARGAAATSLFMLAGYMPEWAWADPPPGLSDLFPTPPFSFKYDGTASSSLLSSWTKTVSTTTLANSVVQTTTTWNSGDGFEVTWVAKQYPDYPNVSWIVYFENTSGSTSAIL